MERKLNEAYDAGRLSGLHSVLVIHQDEILAEAHFQGVDQCWGRPLGERRHGPESLHDLRSVTKSVVGLLYGIARAEGLVPDLDQSVIAQFPDYADLAADPKRRKILLRHALAMQMGTEWSEDLPYTDPKNSEIAMEKAADRYRYVLDRPMLDEPGEGWTYNGGATAIVARLIARGAGMPIDLYAREKLFAPLDIADFEWSRGDDDVPSAASGLRLNIHDLAKIGRLVLDRGKWRGKEIVPAAWLEASFTPQATTGDGPRYGFFWWLGPEGSPPDWVAAIGNGGQRLMIAPQSRLIVAVFAGNYNQAEAWRLAANIILEFALPAVRTG